jgi:hypothetical protein
LIVPTLEAMAEVYRQPTTGGAESPRFKAYVALADKAPVSRYNPMTSKPVLDTIEALLAIDAEGIAGELSGKHEMFITVAAPGMWTDRIATEVEHRLGEPTKQILLWTGEDTTADAVRRETIAQVIRIERRARTTFEVAMREGYAYALSGDDGELDTDVEAALKIVGRDDSLPTKAALLYGDDVARTMGFVPLGLRDRAGYGHCIALARASGVRPR